MMGRIDSRLTQAKAGKNPNDASLGGISCVAVGDPAQCEAIWDQQIYDTKPHQATADDVGKQSVKLSNRGLTIYSEFVKVIILTKTHRLTMIDNPQTKEERAFNDRAQRFVQVLRRFRDLECTASDYYWLCERKRTKLKLHEREQFANAPVLMDNRQATENNPEENCDFYKRANLRQNARRRNVPIIRTKALHTGVGHDAGSK